MEVSLFFSIVMYSQDGF